MYLQVHVPNAKTQYQLFLDEVGAGLQKVTFAKSIVLLGDFNAHVSTDDKTWKAIIGRQGDSDIYKNEKCLLQFCATNGLCIINYFFLHKRTHKSIWYRDSMGQPSIIYFYIVSENLFSSVVDVCVKRGAERSTDHHLIVCIQKDLNHLRTKKQFRTRRAYRIK